MLVENWLKLQSGNGKILPKDCESVTYEPLIAGDDSLLVSEVFTFSSLHIMLGVVNKLCDELEKRWDGFSTWTGSLNLVKEDYFSKTFEVSFGHQ